MSEEYVWMDSEWVKTRDERPVIMIFGRSVRDPSIVKTFPVYGVEPYFYAPADAPAFPKGIVRKDGPYIDAKGRKVVKCVTRLPSDVPQLRNSFEWTDEADVLFDFRFMVDRNIRYGFSVEGKSLIPIQLEKPIQTKFALFDIEVRSPPHIMPLPEDPKFEISSIQLMDSYTKEITLITNGVPFVADDQWACDNEQELFEQFMLWIQEHNPDALSGWYTNQFDIPYIIQRAARIDMPLNNLTRFPDYYKKPRAEQRGFEWMVKVPGRQCFDMLAAFKKWYKAEGELEAWDLKSVSADKRFGNFAYADYGARIDELYRKKDWKTFLQYGRNDVIALDRINTNAKLFDFYDTLRFITGVKLEDTLKNSKMIESLLMRRGMKPMPTRNYKNTGDSFAGALVLDPTAGIHKLVAVFDAAALYPTIIRGFNLSPDIDHLVPIVITEILNEREKLRAIRMAGNADQSTKNKETVLKFIANSFYGVLGWPQFRLYDRDMAEFITRTGQDINRFLQKVAMENGHPAIYGDSVAPTTPVIVRVEGSVFIIPIDHVEIGNEIWNGKWVKVKRVIKKPLSKDIYMIGARVGNVVCTSDHSLVQNGKEISPVDLKRWDSIDIIPLPNQEENVDINEDIAWIIGLYLAEGSRFNGCQFVINGQDNSLLQECVDRVERVCGKIPKISDFMESSNCNRISYLPKEIVYYLKQCYLDNTWYEGSPRPYESTGYKIIPWFILNAPKHILQAFFDGYYEGDGQKGGDLRIDSKNECLALGLQYIATRLHMNVRVQLHKKSLSWGLRFPEGSPRRPLNEITNIEHIDPHRIWFNHVVDIEVEDESHLFASGRILLHNTDSVFLSGFDDVEGGKSMQHVFNEALKGWAKEKGSTLDPTVKFEKLYRRLIFKRSSSSDRVAKKRYAGHIIWKDGQDIDKIDYTGIEIKRSDQSVITKTTMEQFLRKVLLEDDYQAGYRIVQAALERVKRGDVPPFDVSTPRGVKDFEGDDSWARGVRNSEEIFGINFPQGVKPRLIYVHGDYGVICVHDELRSETVLSRIRVDWRKMAEKVVENKMRSFIESCGIPWSVAVLNQQQLSSFGGDDIPYEGERKRKKFRLPRRKKE